MSCVQFSYFPLRNVGVGAADSIAPMLTQAWVMLGWAVPQSSWWLCLHADSPPAGHQAVHPSLQSGTATSATSSPPSPSPSPSSHVGNFDKQLKHSICYSDSVKSVISWNVRLGLRLVISSKYGQ